MNPSIVLFDIDGTLVDCGGAGRRAMELAFEARIGRADVLDFGFGGMTDRAIARKGLSAVGPVSEADIDALVASYLGHLAPELTRSAGFRVLPGVFELLETLRETAGPRVVVGLGTGNVAAGADLKLARGGLLGHFAFGGFGCDSELRPALLEEGARRGAERLAAARSEVDVVVIGDTPRDVEAAHAIGAEVVAVSTGRYDAASLREAGARTILPSLSDPRARNVITGRHEGMSSPENQF